MTDTQNTRMIDLDEPPSDGIIKILNKPTLWEDDLSQETSDMACITIEEDSIPLNLTYGQFSPTSFYEWLGIAAARLSNAMITTFAATQFNIARLSSDNFPTGAFDATAIIRTISEERSFVVNISPDLIMTRTEVRASSLLAPSGAYLAWMDMLRESPDDENK